MKRKYSSTATFALLFLLLSTVFTAEIYSQDLDACSAPGTTLNSKTNALPEVSTTVVISEVYGGSETGGIYNADFIELYNLSADPVDISDWSVQYYTAGQINAGAPTSTAHIPDATILQGHSFYVIRVSPDDRAGMPIPCVALNASASFAETGIASEGGKLVLTNTGADLPSCDAVLPLVIDRVGWGVTPTICNETENAGQPITTAASIQRLVSRPDTDNNRVDFISSNLPTPCFALTPTSAMVSVGGRILNNSGIGVQGTLIKLTNNMGIVRTSVSSTFGYYIFSNVESGTTIILEANDRRLTFIEPLQVISVKSEITSADFTAY